MCQLLYRTWTYRHFSFCSSISSRTI